MIVIIELFKEPSFSKVKTSSFWAGSALSSDISREAMSETETQREKLEFKLVGDGANAILTAEFKNITNFFGSPLSPLPLNSIEICGPFKI
jgi:hypothetical protein